MPEVVQTAAQLPKEGISTEFDAFSADDILNAEELAAELED